jgi:hypothetical protein
MRMEPGAKGERWTAQANLPARWFAPGRIGVTCFLVIVSAAALLGVSIATGRQGHTVFGPLIGSDFPQFYVAGMTLNERAPEQLYDFAAQQRRYHRLFAGLDEGESLPYVYAPFFSAIVRPLASLSYTGALLVWTAASAGLFLAGFALVWRASEGLGREQWRTALLVLAAFEPLLIECLVGGHATAFGFFWIAVTLYFVRTGRAARGGLALSFCLYKPTLLVLIVPMLVASRQFRALGGFAAGALALALVSMLAIGGSACVQYVQGLAGLGANAASSESVFRTFKYVDVRSFFRLLAGGGSVAAPLLAIVTGAAVIPILVRFWMRAAIEEGESRDRLWAATITWTLVLNLYVPIYDTALVALAVVLVAGRVHDERAGFPPTFKLMMLLLWLTPWVTQHVALASGLQPYTLVLAAFGMYQLFGRRPADEIAAPALLESAVPAAAAGA